jgi:WD40 repeat protein/serine/threonine protein kinase
LAIVPVDPEGTTLPPPEVSEGKTAAVGIAQGSGEGEPTDIPGYEILTELGRGGMGVVYKARQVNLNRVVALKMILAGGHAGEAALTRFRTEAQAIALLRHPNIVQIHEVGECGGLPYFSLEFCDGGSLDARLGGTPVPPEDAARLVETLARAMHVAHQANILHRDLKPANVLLALKSDRRTPKPGTGNPKDRGSQRPAGEAVAALLADYELKVSDFGLAKKLDEAGPTATNAVLGTPSYMAPEQARGTSAALGPHTDTYALGAILYECLTGRPPFRTSNPLDTLVQVATAEPVPPAQLNSKVPRDLETICLKCLQKDPAKRYGSALELAEDLHRFVAGEPIRARPVGPLGRLSRWCRRNPTLAGLTAAVFLLLVAVAVVASTGYLVTREALRQEAEQRGLARTAEATARSEAARANRLLYDADMQLAAETWDSPTGTARAVRALLLAHVPEPGTPDLRDFTWRYQWQLLQEGLIPLGGQGTRATRGAFAPDGTLLILDSRGRLHRWDQAKRELTLVADLASGKQVSAELSHDGKTVAVAADGTVRLVDASTGRIRHTLEPAASGRTILGIPQDSRTVLTRDKDGSVRVWDLEKGKLQETVPDAAARFEDVAALSADGTLVADRAGPAKGWLRIIDWRTNKEVATVRHNWTLGAVAFSPDGKLLAYTDVRGWVFRRDLARRQNITPRLQADAGRVAQLAFSADGHTLAAAGMDGVLTAWSLEHGEPLSRFKEHTGAVTFLGFSADGNLLASGSAEGAVRLRRLSDTQQGEQWTESYPINGLAYAPSGKVLAVASGQAVLLRDAETGKLLRSLRYPPRAPVGIPHVAFSPNGQLIATGARGGQLALWAADGGALVHVLRDRDSKAEDGDEGPIGALAFSPDGRFLAVGFGNRMMHGRGKEQPVTVWEPASGKEIVTFPAHVNTIPGLAFSPDSTILATASHDGTVKLWKTGTWEAIRTLKGPAMMKCAAFSPNGFLLAAGAHNGLVTVWEADSGRVLLEFKAHDHFLSGIAFTADGKTLATASMDRLVKLWDPVSGRELRVFRGHDDSVFAIAFSPDGNTLASGGLDHKVFFLRAAPQEVVKQVRPPATTGTNPVREAP